MTKTIHIDGMSCAHCVAAVKSELEALDGASNIQVSLEEKKATLEAGAVVTDDMLREAIGEAGFTVTGIE